MLNLLKYKKNNKKHNKVYDILSLLEEKKENKQMINYTISDNNDQIKHYLPSTKEWYNSIYTFSKKNLQLLPIADKVIFNLTKSYFNLYSKMLNYKIRYRKLRIRIRRISSHRIYVSKAEFKHTFDKLAITFYIFNRQKYNFISKIKKKVLRKKYITLLKKKLFKAKINLIKRKGLNILIKVRNEKKKLFLASSETNTFLHSLLDLRTRNKSRDLNGFNSLSQDLSTQAKQKKEKLDLHMTAVNTSYYKNYIKRSLKREIFHIFYKQVLYLNKSKFENTYLHKLSLLIKKVYNKKIEFNIVSLKSFFLNSDIFSESIAIKLRKRKNRLLRVLKKSLAKVKIANINLSGVRSKDILLSSTLLKNTEQQYLKNNNIKNDPLSFLFKNLFCLQVYAQNACATLTKYKTNAKNSFISKDLHSVQIENLAMYLENIVFNSLKYKAITGVRLEAAGRLTRRFTASRSVFKIRYKGNLKNSDSSYKGLSSPMPRGVLKNNLQYSLIAYKTRIGAYALKNWVSSNS